MEQNAEPTVVCPDCHAVVADLAAHGHWHSSLVSAIAKAVEQEIKKSSTAAG